MITLTANDTDGRKLMLVPMGNEEGATDMALQGDTYQLEMRTSETGFYNLVSIKGQSQIIVPFYVPVTKAEASAQVTFGERGAISIEGNKDNQALAAYATEYGKLSRILWEPTTDLTTPNVLKSFITKADSIIDVHNCSDEVEQYLKLWSYLSAYDNYSSAQRILGITAEEMPYRREDLMGDPHRVLDTPLAALFANTPNIVFANIPNKNNLDSALIYLDTHYTDSTLKARVKDNIANRLRHPLQLCRRL